LTASPRCGAAIRQQTRAWLLATLGFLASGASAQQAGGRDALADYLSAPDPSYAFHEVSTGRIGSVDYVEAILTSQTWRGIPWKHQLFVLRPAHLDPATTQGILFIDGGHWDQKYESTPASTRGRAAGLLAHLAEVARAPVAIVRQVPFQPIFDRKEDALIAYTFQQYFSTGEADWPLLLPMVKSASRAMDAVQQLSREHWGLSLSRFTVTGASKRGWTSWLTAAVDPRVASVAPMVINMLNFPAQVQLHRQTFGGLSASIHDYEQLQLPEQLDTPAGRKLLAIVDPYSYRERLNEPKLILLGTNDPYWPLDALKAYWQGLPEEKRVLYLPNQTHDLRDVQRVIASVTALHRYSANGKALPRVRGTFVQQPGVLELTVGTDQPAVRVRAWTATSPGRAFSHAHWSVHGCKRSGSGYLCRVHMSGEHYTALLGEVTFRDPSAPDFSLSTQVCIAGGPQEGDPGCQ